MGVPQAAGVTVSLWHRGFMSAMPTSGNLHGNPLGWKKESVSGSQQLAGCKEYDKPGPKPGRRLWCDCSSTDGLQPFLTSKWKLLTYPGLCFAIFKRFWVTHLFFFLFSIWGFYFRIIFTGCSYFLAKMIINNSLLGIAKEGFVCL